MREKRIGKGEIRNVKLKCVQAARVLSAHVLKY